MRLDYSNAYKFNNTYNNNNSKPNYLKATNMYTRRSNVSFGFLDPASILTSLLMQGPNAIKSYNRGKLLDNINKCADSNLHSDKLISLRTFNELVLLPKKASWLDDFTTTSSLAKKYDDCGVRVIHAFKSLDDSSATNQEAKKRCVRNLVNAPEDSVGRLIDGFVVGLKLMSNQMNDRYYSKFKGNLVKEVHYNDLALNHKNILYSSYNLSKSVSQLGNEHNDFKLEYFHSEWFHVTKEDILPNLKKSFGSSKKFDELLKYAEQKEKAHKAVWENDTPEPSDHADDYMRFHQWDTYP